MRGAQQFSILPANRAGIIPADAGSTVVSGLPRISGRDHPRGCGEHGDHHGTRYHAGESSPRMRGARCWTETPVYDGRIIPADAGSTTYTDATRPRCRDHPRGCGEHHEHSDLGQMEGGSSPRMRGAHDLAAPHTPFGRIIPADAGSTAVVRCSLFACRDHPRGCGEHSMTRMLPTCNGGSSPRMRGARAQHPLPLP